MSSALNWSRPFYLLPRLALAVVLLTSVIEEPTCALFLPLDAETAEGESAPEQDGKSTGKVELSASRRCLARDHDGQAEFPTRTSSFSVLPRALPPHFSPAPQRASPLRC